MVTVKILREGIRQILQEGTWTAEEALLVARDDGEGSWMCRTIASLISRVFQIAVGTSQRGGSVALYGDDALVAAVMRSPEVREIGRLFEILWEIGDLPDIAPSYLLGRIVGQVEESVREFTYAVDDGYVPGRCVSVPGIIHRVRILRGPPRAYVEQVAQEVTRRFRMAAAVIGQWDDLE